MAKDANSFAKPGGRFNKFSPIFLTSGGIMCVASCLATVLSITLPYWVFIRATLETTVAGLTEDTDITYHYGLIGYCLDMKATHVSVDQCTSRDVDTLEWWERTALYTLISSSCLCAMAGIMVTLNLRCWDKLPLLVLSTVTAATAGVCQTVAVSGYQIYSSTMTVQIGGMTSTKFQQNFLHAGFWLGFTAAIIGLLATLLLMLGTFTWQRPKESRRFEPRYETTVFAPRRCPHRGREPVVIEVSHA